MKKKLTVIASLVTAAALIAVAMEQTRTTVRGDLDGNGRGDLVIGTADGVMSLLSMNGRDILSSEPLFGGQPVELFRLAATTDLNGDGLEDLIFEYNGQHDAVFSGDTTGTVTLFGGTTAPWHAVAGGDFDGDGIGDVVFQYADTGFYATSLMNGTNVLSADYLWNGEDISPWRVNGGGDFDGDGKADLVLRDGTNYAYAIAYMDTFIQRDASYVTTGNSTDLTPWNLDAVSDLNGDGTSDLILSGVRGEKFVLYMHGATGSAGDYVGGSSSNYIPGATFAPR